MTCADQYRIRKARYLLQRLGDERNTRPLQHIRFVLGSWGLGAWLAAAYMHIVALGLAGVFLGVTSLMLGRYHPQLSPEASVLLPEAGWDNIAMLVEELGVRSRALYLPSSLTAGLPRVLIPLRSNGATPVIGPLSGQRFLVRFQMESEEWGILVATPGSYALELQQVSPGSSPTDLSALLVDTLDIAESIHVRCSDASVMVEVDRHAFLLRNHVSNEILGSPVAAIVATLVVAAVDRPVLVGSESDRRQRHVIELEVVEQK